MRLLTRLRRARRRHAPDYLIIFCVFFLVTFGLVMLASASSNLGQIRFGDSYYYLRHQVLFGLTLGILGFLISSKVYYRYYEKFSIVLLLSSVILLALVFTDFGIGAGGAARWLEIGPIIFQPSELLKIFLVVYLAAWLGRKKERLTSLAKGLIPLLAVLTLITFILIKQPSTTSAIILLATALIIYFVSGARLSYIIGTVIVGMVVFTAIMYSTPYRWQRIESFLNPEANPLSSGYHINQSLIAIGSGGIWGVGFGQSTAKLSYLPEPMGDSIFAVVAEELGFAGAIAVIGVITALVFRILYIAAKCQDKFGQLMLVGFASIIAIQSFINIASVSGVIPLTGAPLPFVSYGGTSLAVFMTIAGIINNVSRYRL